MSSQKKLSEIDNIDQETRNNIGRVLDLEKKYFNILWNLFSSDAFINDLKTIVYPSAVSSDVAFITEDAVINIDIKTLDKVGNAGDIRNLQCENNQCSFVNTNLDINENYENSGVRVECLLPKTYSYNNGPALPMLTYFFTIVYCDTKRDFSLCRDEDLQTIYLKNLPNGLTSILYDNDLVDNFKTYTYLEEKHGFPPVFLTEHDNEVNDKIRDFVANNNDFVLISGRTKLGAYNNTQIHPKYNTYGVSWFPVKRKIKNSNRNRFYLEAVYKGSTNRIKNDKLQDRYDSHDGYWAGIKKITVSD